MAGLFGNITNSAPNWVGLGLGLSLAKNKDPDTIIGLRITDLSNSTIITSSILIFARGQTINLKKQVNELGLRCDKVSK